MAPRLIMTSPYAIVNFITAIDRPIRTATTTKRERREGSSDSSSDWSVGKVISQVPYSNGHLQYCGSPRD